MEKELQNENEEMNANAAPPDTCNGVERPKDSFDYICSPNGWQKIDVPILPGEPN